MDSSKFFRPSLLCPYSRCRSKIHQGLRRTFERIGPLPAACCSHVENPATSRYGSVPTGTSATHQLSAIPCMMAPMAEHSFAVKDGAVEVRLAGATVWAGKVLGVSAIDAFPLPGTQDGVIVLDPMDRPDGVEAWHPYENVVRVSTRWERRVAGNSAPS